MVVPSEGEGEGGRETAWTWGKTIIIMLDLDLTFTATSFGTLLKSCIVYTGGMVSYSPRLGEAEPG